MNKSAIESLQGVKGSRGRASSSTLSSMVPSTAVMINWHQTATLSSVRDQWMVDSAVRLNPKLRLSPKYQPLALHAITRLDLSNNELVSIPISIFRYCQDSIIFSNSVYFQHAESQVLECCWK